MEISQIRQSLKCQDQKVQNQVATAVMESIQCFDREQSQNMRSQYDVPILEQSINEPKD